MTIFNGMIAALVSALVLSMVTAPVTKNATEPQAATLALVASQGTVEELAQNVSEASDRLAK